MEVSDMDAFWLLLMLNTLIAPVIFLTELGLALWPPTRRFALPLALGTLGGIIAAALAWRTAPVQWFLLAFSLIGGPIGVYCAVRQTLNR
jgi:hypothetical protein